MRGLSSLELASHAQLWVVRVPWYGMALREGGRLLVGPFASRDAIATIAARRLVQLRCGQENVSERLVRQETRRWGFQYVGPANANPASCTANPRTGNVHSSRRR